MNKEESMNENIDGINRVTFREKMASYKKHPGSFCLFLLVLLAIGFTVAVLGYLILYILIKGVPHLTPSLFAWKYNSDNVSMLPSLINTVLMTLLALIVAVPIGIFSAIYLVEYAKKWK